MNEGLSVEITADLVPQQDEDLFVRFGLSDCQNRCWKGPFCKAASFKASQVVANGLLEVESKYESRV